MGETLKREILALDLWTEKLLVVVRAQLLGIHLLLDMLPEGFFMGLIDPKELGVDETKALVALGDGLDLLEIVFDNLIKLDQRDQGGFLDLLVNRPLRLLQIFDKLHQENLHQNPRDDEDLDIIKILTAQKLL